MFNDLRQFADNAVIETTLCIVGAGPAGISIAREFIGQDVEVSVVESGGVKLEWETQALCKGEIVGMPYIDLDASRLRLFGGTSNLWGGMCAPLNDIDFEKRPWVPHSGWPIKKCDLDPYYERAQVLLKIGPYRYDPDAWEDDAQNFLEFLPENLVSRLWQISWPPTRFGKAYGTELRKAENVQVLFNANATEIETNDTASHVERVRLRTLEGKTAFVRPKVLILACGGIETPRLLLLSNKVEITGLGNRYDLVGRFFMEHPHVMTGPAVMKRGVEWLKLYRGFGRDRIWLVPAICASEKAQRREEILNYCAKVEVDVDPNAGYLAFKRIVKLMLRDLAYGSLLRRTATSLLAPVDLYKGSPGSDIWHVISRFDDVARGIYARLTRKMYHAPTKQLTKMFLLNRSEQTPNPESRIMLSQDQDALGLNKVRLDWRLTELDKRTIRVGNQLIGQEFDRLGCARLQLEDWLLANDNSWSPNLYGGNHHMGTTRMSDDPKQGVVDRSCRVHGVSNLYIAGSSVFPTGGWANPVLTIVAISLRLADYIKRDIGLL